MADVGNVKVHLTGDASGLRRELQGIAPAAREAGIAGAQELGKITTAAGQAGDVIRKQLRGGFEGMSPAALEQIASKMGGVARETENVGKAAGHTHGQVTGLSSGLGTATRHVLGLGMALTGFYGFRSFLRAAFSSTPRWNRRSWPLLRRFPLRASSLTPSGNHCLFFSR